MFKLPCSRNIDREKDQKVEHKIFYLRKVEHKYCDDFILVGVWCLMMH